MLHGWKGSPGRRRSADRTWPFPGTRRHSGAFHLILRVLVRGGDRHLAWKLLDAPVGHFILCCGFWRGSPTARVRQWCPCNNHQATLSGLHAWKQPAHRAPRAVDRGGYHPGGWEQGRGRAPSPHKPDPGHDGTGQGSLPVATPKMSLWKI